MVGGQACVMHTNNTATLVVLFVHQPTSPTGAPSLPAACRHPPFNCMCPPNACTPGKLVVGDVGVFAKRRVVDLIGVHEAALAATCTAVYRRLVAPGAAHCANERGARSATAHRVLRCAAALLLSKPRQWRVPVRHAGVWLCCRARSLRHQPNTKGAPPAALELPPPGASADDG